MPLQHTWLAKLMGYGYEITYKRGFESIVADILSRVPGAELIAITLSTVSTKLMVKVRNRWTADEEYRKIILQLE